MCEVIEFLQRLEGQARQPARRRKSRYLDDRPSLLLPQPILCMTQSCYIDIMDELTERPPEAGGMLLGPTDEELVTHYVPDENAVATSASFTLGAAGLNAVLRQYRECSMNCKGLVHSHPRGCTRPSHGDLEYVRRSLANTNNQAATQFLLPIVCGERLYPYVIRREEDEVLLAQLVLV